MSDDSAVAAGIQFVRAAGWPCSLRLGEELRFVATNDAYDAMIGRSVEGQTLIEAFPEVVEQGMLALHQGVMRTGTPERHEDRRVFLRGPCGELVERYFTFTYQPWYGPSGIIGVIGMALETTEAVRTREALKRTLARLESETSLLNRLVANAPVAIALARAPDWSFEVCNRAMADIFRRPLEEVRGRSVFDFAPGLAAQGFRDLMDQVAATGEPYVGVGIPVTIEGPDGPGPLRRFDFVYERLPGEDEPVELLIVAHDVTAIHDAREALERTLKARDDFSRAVAHDLRTPLNAISGWMQVLGRMRGDPARVDQAVRVVQRNVDAIAQLLDDLAVVRAGGGPVELNRIPVDLSALVADAIEALRPRAAGAHLTLSSRLDPRCDVYGDPTRLQQVINNLLANALKYGSPGAGTSTSEVRVEVARHGEQVVLTVADEGRGIAPELVERVFEPYFQGDPESPGLGLGLSICRSLVEAHGGALSVRSEGLGRGATFEVRLPWCEPVVPHDDTVDEAPRVLLVEDHADTRAFMIELLRMCGLEVHAVRDGAEAMAFLEAADVDMVVSDLNMPRIDGIAMAHAFAAQGYNLPAIAITANTDADTVTRAREAGFLQVLAKPVSLDALRAAIDRMLGR